MQDERCEICDGFDCECEEVCSRDYPTDGLHVLPQYVAMNPRMANTMAYVEHQRMEAAPTPECYGNCYACSGDMAEDRWAEERDRVELEMQREDWDNDMRGRGVLYLR